MDDSIKQFSIQPHPTYPSTSKICMAELCTELLVSVSLANWVLSKNLARTVHNYCRSSVENTY